MNKIIQFKQLRQLISAIFFETVREPGVLFWGIAFPILMSLGLGLAFSKKSDITRKVAVIENSGRTSTSSTDTCFTVEKFLKKNGKVIAADGDKPMYYKIIIPDEKLGNTIFLFQETNWAQATILLKRGNVSLVVDEKNNQPVFHFDPSNTDAQLIYLRLKELFSGKISIAGANTSDIEPLTVSGTRYIDFLIPGLIAMGIMMSCLWGVSYGIIEKRSKKLLRRMVATPMKKSHFLIALITVRTVMNFVEGSLLFLVAHLVFNFQLQGSIIALLTIFVAGNIAFAGISVFISSRTSNTEIGNGLINAVNMPMLVLSGIFFSYHNFPDWAIPYIQKLPLTIMADDMRSVFIEGAGFADISLHALILALTGIVFFSVGLKIFKWH
jgi:ABC-2 type transport system permease protein